MGFTNFCCRSGGSNLNAGTRTGDTTEPGTSASFTYTSGNSNGTDTFTVPGGSNPQTDGVAVGDWGSVYLNAATVAVFIGRVTSVTSTTIVFSTTVKSGTFPTSGTGTVTCKIGGAWAGPNGSSGFPLSFMTNTAINGMAQPVRINMKNDVTYSVSTAIGYTSSAGVNTEGYSSSYGDGGLATISASTAIVLLTFSGAGKVKHIKFTNSVGTGTSAGVTMFTAGATLERCVITGVRGNGITIAAAVNVLGCEIYDVNKANTSGAGGISAGGSGTYIADCIIHDNTDSNNCGIQVSAHTRIERCIIETNGLAGIRCVGNFVALIIDNCDFYNNTGDGINFNSATGYAVVKNCNFIKNGGYGVNGTNLAYALNIINCGFGTGTMANTSGKTTGNAIELVGSVDYPSDVNPYIDSLNGDFRIKIIEALDKGYNNYIQQASSYSGVVGVPLIGAVPITRGGYIAPGGFKTGGAM